MQDAVKYGKIGAKAFLDTGAFTSDLNPKQREMAYEIGKITAENEAKREAQRKQRTTEKDGLPRDKVSGGIRFDGITEKDLNETQRTTVSVFKQLFGGYGVTIEFFKSPINERGTHTGENGSYDPKTNTIRLDINAGAQGKDTILFTAAHELTHFIKQWSPEKFRVFGEFLLNSYAKHGVSVDDLIKEQQAKAERNGRELDYEAAYEEVVADSCETFLRDSKLFDKLLNLKQQDKSLFEKTKEYISKLFDKVAALRHKYRSFMPDSKEGKIVSVMTDTIEQLHRLWEDAAMTALENSRRASVTTEQKTTTEKGGEVERLSQRDNSDNSIKDQLKANLNILNSMETVASIQEFKTFEYKQQTLDWVLKRLENTGYKVNRKGFGEIIIDKKRLKSGLSYSKTNEEKLAFAVLPQVLAKGVEIDTHTKHKNRAYDTVTFAAPVVINGQRGNMAVVVRQEGKNYYKVHRLVMPDGSQFILNKKRDIAETAGGVDNNSGLSPTDNVSKNNILDLTENVKKNSLRDTEGNKLSEGQQEYFKDSKVRDDNGNLKVMYHGSPNADFTVFKSGTYFTEHKWYADVYQGQGASSLGYKKTANKPDTYSGYLNIKKPFDTRNKAERDIFYNEYYQQWGTGTKLQESGLPDWLDGQDLQEFLEEKGYDYDGLILDEGGTGGYGENVVSRGISYVIFNPAQFKSLDNQNPTTNPDIRYSVREIIGEDGINYGVGVYLDSQKLANLSEKERIDKVREHIKELGGHPFSAFDSDDNEVKIKVAPKTKYLNEKGKWERANRHLTNFVMEKEKQESLILIDEIIGAATFKEHQPAKHDHGWLDNNGKNEWDLWTTYIQDKENTIWEAKLKVANTTNGEKILYDVYPIEKVGPGRTMPEKPTKNKIPQDTTESQGKNSLRDPAFVSDREILVDALMSAVRNDGEYQILTDYKNNIKQMYMQQQKLDRINKEIKELKQTEPNWYTDTLKKLYEEATKTRNRINNYDKKLLKLEAAAPIRAVIAREKKIAEKKQKEIDAEKLKNAKADLKQKNSEKLANYRESLKKSEMRRKIRHVISELNGYYAHGNKKKNVKIDLQGTAAAVRTVKTMAETAIALIGTNTIGITQVDWLGVASACALSGVVTVLTCIKGLPEVKE